LCWTEWGTSIIPAFGRLRQDKLEFKASLGYSLTYIKRKNKMITIVFVFV
jgi:hypothetical protein